MSTETNTTHEQTAKNPATGKPSSLSKAPPRPAAAPTSAPAGREASPHPRADAKLPPCERDVDLDPETCQLMPGHQHPPENLGELADSIRIVGQLHAGQVFAFPSGEQWVVAGRRRWLACKERGYRYRADVWRCSSPEDPAVADLACRIRVMENEQRVDPSAYDLAVQLRRIRNEHAYQSADQLAAHVAMSTTRVKEYLSIFRGSDRLIEAAESHRIPLETLLQLVRIERQFGEARGRGFIQKAVAGDVSAADLRRQREVAKRGKRGARAKGDADALAKAITDRFRKFLKADRARATKLIDAMRAELAQAEAAPGA
jgi:ParB-like chromosome segregation protein Spo0J